MKLLTKIEIAYIYNIEEYADLSVSFLNLFKYYFVFSWKVFLVLIRKFFGKEVNINFRLQVINGIFFEYRKIEPLIVKPKLNTNNKQAKNKWFLDNCVINFNMPYLFNIILSLKAR